MLLCFLVQMEMKENAPRKSNSFECLSPVCQLQQSRGNQFSPLDTLCSFSEMVCCYKTLVPCLTEILLEFVSIKKEPMKDAV